MTTVNYLEAMGAGLKNYAESYVKDLKVIGGAIGSVFQGDLEGAAESMSEYEIPAAELIKAGAENIEEQEENGAESLLETIGTATTENTLLELDKTQGIMDVLGEIGESAIEAVKNSALKGCFGMLPQHFALLDKYSEEITEE